MYTNTPPRGRRVPLLRSSRDRNGTHKSPVTRINPPCTCPQTLNLARPEVSEQYRDVREEVQIFGKMRLYSLSFNPAEISPSFDSSHFPTVIDNQAARSPYLCQLLLNSLPVKYETRRARSARCGRANLFTDTSFPSPPQAGHRRLSHSKTFEFQPCFTPD